MMVQLLINGAAKVKEPAERIASALLGSVAWILQNHQKRGGCDYSRRVVHSATRVPVAKAMSGPRVADLSSGGVTRRDKSPGDLHYGNVSVHPCNRRARRRRKDHDATLC